MNNRQSYINRYRDIVSGLGIYGDSAEILIQLLAEATYISEIENAVYMQEASLEKCSLMNSKIQHCMDDMYSVFRGSCPRVIFRFIPTRYFDFKPFDTIYTGSGFKVYYLGYLRDDEKTKTEPITENVAVTNGFEYSGLTVPPDLEKTYTIIGLLAKEKEDYTFKTSVNYGFYVGNTNLDNLSSDMYCQYSTVADVWNDIAVTRNFSEHIMDRKVFDLTIPDFGSRLYVAGITEDPSMPIDETTTEPNIDIRAVWYKYSTLSEYNMAELKKMAIKGTNPVSFDGGEFQNISESAKGLILIPESPRDTLDTIHYRANKDRYVSTVIRTNNDIGTLLEETYPENVTIGGTTYRFSSSDSGSSLEIFYVPREDTNLLSDDKIQDFIDTKRGYFVTNNIKITAGTKYKALINMDLELYQSDSVIDEINIILSDYSRKFNTNLDELSNEIKSQISKISNIKQILSFSIDYVLGDSILEEQDKIDMFSNLDHVYYEIDPNINTKIQLTKI